MMQSGREAGRRPSDRESSPLISCGTPQAQDSEQAVRPRASRLIAIVEDDDTLAMTFQQVLEEERGWETVVLGDGAEAMRVLPAARPDMILLDVTLPGLDGISLYRMLRGRRETWSIPILIVTASHEWELQRLGLEPHQLLRKPFELDDLLAAIERLLPDAPEDTPAAQDVS